MSLRVLHFVGWYFPDSVGGSEQYVDSLVRALQPLGIDSEVAVPAAEFGSYDYRGVTVHRFVPAGPAGPDAFRAWLAERNPDLVHFHTVTQGLGYAEAREAKALGRPLVMTVHVPGVTCVRGTMLHWGSEVCDGRMEVPRCTACFLQERGLSRPLAHGFASLPVGWSRRLAAVGGRVGTVLGMPAQVDQRTRRVRQLLQSADRVVAVCRWLYDTLLANGVPREKLVLSRQASDLPPAAERAERRPRSGPIRIGYLGRYNAVKGVATLIEAVRALPDDAAIELRLHGPANGPDEADYLNRLRAMASGDRRIALRGPLPRAEFSAFFRDIDVLAVPSLLLETGPLVVYEALAHGVPVLGSNLGGIPELVEAGVTGWLLPPGNVRAWAAQLRKLADEPDAFAFFRRPTSTRTWADAATENLTVYRSVLDTGSSSAIRPSTSSQEAATTTTKT